VIACATVVLEGDNTLGDRVFAVAFDILNFLFGKIGVVGGIGEEFLDLVLKLANVDGVTACKKLVGRVDLDDDDVPAIDFLVVQLLSLCRA